MQISVFIPAVKIVKTLKQMNKNKLRNRYATTLPKKQNLQSHQNTNKNALNKQKISTLCCFVAAIRSFLMHKKETIYPIEN